MKAYVAALVGYVKKCGWQKNLEGEYGLNTCTRLRSYWLQQSLGGLKKPYIKLSNSKNFNSVSKLKIKQSQFSIQKFKLKIKQSPFKFRNLIGNQTFTISIRNLPWKSNDHHFNSEFQIENQTISMSIQKSKLENKQLAFQFRTLTWTYNSIFFTFQILILIWFTIWHNYQKIM